MRRSYSGVMKVYTLTGIRTVHQSFKGPNIELTFGDLNFMRRIIEFDNILNTFGGPIVDWCKSLPNSKICEVRLLSVSGSSRLASLVTVVSLEDDSVYRFQRTLKWARDQILPNTQDTIERVWAPNIGLNSHTLVAVNFKQSYRPSLLFLIRVCYCIQKYRLIFKAPQVVMDCHDNFLPLALVLNLTRSCLPHTTPPEIPLSDDSLVGELWQDIYQLLLRQGYAFWEYTIVGHTKSLATELVCRLARHKIALVLGDKPGNRSPSSIAASTVARIGTMVDKKELADQTIWDKAWGVRWKEVWHEDGPTAPGRLRPSFFTCISGDKANTFLTPVDGRDPGRIAGRALVKLIPKESSCTLLNAVWSRANNKSAMIHVDQCKRTSAQGVESQAENESFLSRTMELARYGCSDNVNHYCTVHWLGNACLPELGSYQIWATPRECAIEFAWEMSWSRAESHGKSSASRVLGGNGDEPFLRATQSTYPGILALISAGKAVARFASKASLRISASLRRERREHRSSTNVAVPTTNSTDTIDRIRHSNQTLPNISPPTPRISTPVTGGLRYRQRSNSVARIPNSRVTTPIPWPSTPRARKSSDTFHVQGQHSLSPDDSNYLGVSQKHGLPSRVRRLSSPEIGISSSGLQPVTTPVRKIARRKSAPSTLLGNGSVSPQGRVDYSGSNIRTLRQPLSERLQKRVVTHWRNPLGYSELEKDFIDKVQERTYRNKKETACIQATHMLDNAGDLETALQEIDIKRQAAEAWERVVTLSGQRTFEQELRKLAQEEWGEQVRQRGKARSSFSAGDQPHNWESRFISAWERAWKESWAAAWEAVWRKAYREAALRGAEFGVEEVLDLNLKLTRKTYKRIESRTSYHRLQEYLLGNKSPLGTLEQIHQWMKELVYLSASLEYALPALHDECMEIEVMKRAKAKTLATPMERLGTTEVELAPMKMSHYELQEWLANEFILKEVDNDRQLHALFLRGVADVWEMVSEMDLEGTT